jgi:hypothetical protein
MDCGVAWKAHDDEVMAVAAVGPSKLLSCGADGSICLWDLRPALKRLATNPTQSPKVKMNPVWKTTWLNEVSELMVLNEHQFLAIAGSVCGLFDLRLNSSDSAAAADGKQGPLVASYEHPVELCCFGQTIAVASEGAPSSATAQKAAPTDSSPSPAVAWVLDEDGSINALQESNLRMYRPPFGSQKNIGSGLSLVEYSYPANSQSNSSSVCGLALNLCMDGTLQLYSSGDGPMTSTDRLVVDWRTARMDLAAAINVGAELSASTGNEKQGKKTKTRGSTEITNPPLATSMDIQWPFVAIGRADGQYVVVEVGSAVPRRGEDSSNSDAQSAPATTSTSPFSLEVALQAPGHQTNGLCQVQWYKGQNSALQGGLLTVALSGEVFVWAARSACEPLVVDNDEEAGCSAEGDDVAVLAAVNIRLITKNPHSQMNTAMFLDQIYKPPAPVNGGGVEGSGLSTTTSIGPGVNVVVGCNDGWIVIGQLYE